MNIYKHIFCQVIQHLQGKYLLVTVTSISSPSTQRKNQFLSKVRIMLNLAVPEM